MATNKMIRKEADVAGSFGKWLKNTFEILLLIYNYYCCYSPLSCKWADTVKLSSSVAVSLLICFVLLVLGDTWQMRREKQFYNWEALFVAGLSLQSCRVDVWKCVNFYVLQHVFAKMLKCTKSSRSRYTLKTSILWFLLIFSCKKVVRKFGQNMKSVYLCIRNREGHPLRW